MGKDADQYRKELHEQGMAYLKRLESRFEASLQVGQLTKAELLLDKYDGAQTMMILLGLFDGDADHWASMQERFRTAYLSSPVGKEGPK